MKNQLSDISTQYRKFSKGQYIEYTQFNEFLDFFEDQDRLSRVMLQGVGIVCGFKPNLIYTNRILSSLRLSQGVAVTTDGDLLTLNNTNKVSEDLYVSDLKTIDIESKDYTHFKVYDNFKVEYPAFYQDGKQIELWELATAQEADSGFQPINNLSNLDDKYLLLYLENYEKEVKPCRGVDCDNHGIQQIRNLKVLVTTAKGIANILGKDHIQPHPLFIDDIMGYGKQERVIVERLIEGQGIDKEFLSSDIKSLYATVLKNNDYGRIIFEKINAIAQLIGLPIAYYQGFKNTLESFLTQSAGFQYAYDVVKDLADTYYEIIKLLPKAFTVNLPDVDSFPKHVMLGKLIPGNQLDFSRHQFYNSAVLDDEKSTQKVKLLINRFVQQAQNFRNFPVTDNGNAQIKIIPSQKLNPLSHKAVPFYYTVNDEFLKSWNFDKTSNRSFRDNLGYNNWLSSDEYVVKPLDFNIDKNSFYNIEGHQGMHYQKAFDLLNQIRNKQQLGFDVMVLSLAELVDNKDMFKAYFNEYVEKHPGLEHKHGVERGGTFIIVHESLENPTVFADFSLPYICCTPKVKIGLSLPNTVICSEASRIPFTVIPVNGVVKATIGSDPTGVELVNGKYFFNPKLVSPQLYGQAIGFTVNGKPTNCSIKVIAEPKVKVAVTSVSYADGDPTTATVEFTVSGQNFTDYTYSWDFWDNGGWVTMNPNSRGFVSYTFHNLNPKIIPTIRVRVGNSGCTQEIAIGNWYHVPSAPTVVVDDINFSDGINCCEGSIPVIKAEATGPETVFIRDGSFIVQGQGDGPSTLLYSWAKIKGPTATLSGVNSPELEVKDLAVGEYIFQLTVVDVDSGLFAKSQEVVVNVIYEG